MSSYIVFDFNLFGDIDVHSAGAVVPRSWDRRDRTLLSFCPWVRLSSFIGHGTQFLETLFMEVEKSIPLKLTSSSMESCNLIEQVFIQHVTWLLEKSYLWSSSIKTRWHKLSRSWQRHVDNIKKVAMWSLKQALFSFSLVSLNISIVLLLLPSSVNQHRLLPIGVTLGVIGVLGRGLMIISPQCKRLLRPKFELMTARYLRTGCKPPALLLPNIFVSQPNQTN